MYFEILLILLAAVLLWQTARSHIRLSRALRAQKNSSPLVRYPSVSVIRPIKGLDVGAQENLRASLDNDYPASVETIFVFDNQTEPALALAQKAIAAAAASIDRSASILFSGEPLAGRTGKLHAMIAGLAKAKGEIVVFADSDIRTGRQSLAQLVETLMSDEKAGSAFAPVVVTSDAETLGDAGYAMMINGLYGPAAAAAAASGGGKLPFIMGQFMAFRREALAAIGGLQSVEGQLVDDMYIGARVQAAGFDNRVVPQSVPIIQHGVGLGEFLRTYARWLTFSRSGLPGRQFKIHGYVRGAVFWLGLAASAIAWSQSWWLAAALSGLAPMAVSLSYHRLHRMIGGGRLHGFGRLVAFAVLLSAPLVLAMVSFKRELRWRGRIYNLNQSGRLATGRALKPDQVCTDCEQSS